MMDKSDGLLSILVFFSVFRTMHPALGPDSLVDSHVGPLIPLPSYPLKAFSGGWPF